MILKQSTAATILVGPILDSTGAAKTDEVVGSIKVTKNGTVGAANGSATLTHDHAGKYKLALTATDCDTVGVLEISLNSGTNDMPIARFNVVEEAVYDAMFAASAAGYQVPIWASSSSTVNLSATTVKTLTDAVSLPSSATIAITGNITGNVSGSVGSVTGNVGGNVVGTVASVTGNVAGSVVGAVGSVTGNVAGNVIGYVGSVSGNVGGNVFGFVSTLADDAISAGSVSAAAVTKIQNGLATPTNITAGTITTTTNLTNLPTMSTDWITAAGLSAGAVTEIQSGLMTSAGYTAPDNSGITAIKAKTDLIVSFPANFSSLVVSAGGVVSSDTVQINSSALAAVRLALSATQIIPGTVTNTGFAPTATEFEVSDITEATNDHFNGRIIIFTSGALSGQATEISDYTLSGGRGHFTVVALTEAPINADTFIII